MQDSKTFDSYMGSKKKIRENVGPLLIGWGNLVAKDINKVSKHSLPWPSLIKVCTQAAYVFVFSHRVWE